MESKKIVRSLLFATLLSGSLIALGGVAQADCPAGYQNNLDIDVTTGVSVYYCTPSGEQNISQYDPNITPNAPVAAPEFTPTPTPSADPVPTPTPDLSTSTDATLSFASDSVPSLNAVVADPNDPFPDLQYGDAIEGTFVAGQQVTSCPDGTSPAIDFNVRSQVVTGYCVKTYRTPVPVVTDPTSDTVDPAVVDTQPLKLGGLAGDGVARGD